jgi:hypothetical protein
MTQPFHNQKIISHGKNTLYDLVFFTYYTEFPPAFLLVFKRVETL